MEMKDLIKLIQTVCETKMTKFELKDGEFKVSMTLGPREKKHPAPEEEEKKNEETVPCVKQPEAVLPEGYPYAAENADGLIMVTSPLVGVFYAAAGQGEPPFASVGDRVEKGQTVGIIEAMKFMNEIPAPCSGVVESVLAENEQMVEYGQPLVQIRPQTEG